MQDEDAINVDLLKKMMMGGFSSDSSGFVAKKDKTSKQKAKRKVEIDLHFDAVFPQGGSTPHNKRLPMQLEVLQEFITDSKKNSVTIAYVIVGKGEGKLKSMVSNELTRQKISHSLVADPPYFGNAFKLSF
ncbi:MAG: hypothetical protein QMC70_10150 [Bacteroidia bacterium]